MAPQPWVFPDFPSPGILFEDILPIFSNPTLHEALIRALELHIHSHYGPNQGPDIIVGLEARGFLFEPSLALRLVRLGRVLETDRIKDQT